IKMIIDTNQLAGHEVLVTGDGIVEIQNAREFGCIALGLYTEETNAYGMNKRKKDRLIEAGSHIVMPDFSCYKELLNFLYNQ
ncbi:hypothetical protein KAH55_14230, partial [bacterium]|nr:hypothetical protein [bacterium]